MSLPEGFQCANCGEDHKFPGYVFAHWDEELIHTCKCGAQHELLAGVATRINSTVSGAQRPLDQKLGLTNPDK